MLFDKFEEMEAVKKAALIEENGHKFYSILAERTSSEDAKAVFRKFAADELKHLKVIEGKFFPEAGLNEQITEEELAIEDYVEKSGSGDIFTRRIDVEALLRVVDSQRKALIVALDTERHSVQFFSSLSEKCQTPEARKLYEELAEEEKRHVSEIESLLVKTPE